MKINSICPKLTQKRIAKKTGFSDSTIKRYGTDMNINGPYECYCRGPK